jgi:hypothetical protein
MKTTIISNGVKKTIFTRLRTSSNASESELGLLNSPNLICEVPFIEQIPTKDMAPEHKKIKKNDSSTGEICSICFEQLSFGEVKRKLNCKHAFHKKCIDKWFKKNINCPVCRTDIA